MNGILRRIGTAISSPGSVSIVTRTIATKAYWLLKQGRTGASIGFLIESIVGWNPYYERLVRRHPERFVVTDVRDHWMKLDSHDTGISRTLLSYGTHEHLSTSVFENELRRLAAEITGEITVLEIGANIGYFSLVEAETLGTRARIHAIEPEPENASLLERNVALNGHEDVVDIERCAIGDTVDPVELHVSDLSNRHGIRRASDDAGSTRSAVMRHDAETVANTNTPSLGTVPVRQTTVDRFLADRDISPDAVDAIRMDVEGYETAIFAGMESVLEATTPLVIYLEFHQNYLTDGSAKTIVTALAENGFEIVSAVNEVGATIGGVPRWYGRQLDIETFEDLLAEDHYVELVVRR
jgi:FkbM family methyltransferase